MGIWVGRRWDANENLVITEFGMSHPRSVRKLPMEQRWDATAVQAVKLQSWGDDDQDQEAPPIFQEQDP